VIVDGKLSMKNGNIPGVDFVKLREGAQAAGETSWSTLPDWDPLGRSAEEACPYCYPERD
jgi:5-methylthioadenosine/S-adenosylhomocysteine deaminase